MQKIVDNFGGMFADFVADARGVDAKAVRGMEAGIFFGQDIIEQGLADGVYQIYGGGESGSSEYTANVGEATVTDPVEPETEKEVETLDLKELKEKHPDLYQQVMKEGAESANAQHQEEATQLQSQLNAMSTKLDAVVETNAQLRKDNEIRAFNEATSRADAIWAQQLAASRIPEEWHAKVQGCIASESHIDNGVLDEASLTAAIKAEIQDWEEKGVVSSRVRGGVPTPKATTPETKLTAEDQEKADEELASKMLAMSGDPAGKNAA